MRKPVFDFSGVRFSRGRHGLALSLGSQPILRSVQHNFTRFSRKKSALRVQSWFSHVSTARSLSRVESGGGYCSAWRTGAAPILTPISAARLLACSCCSKESELDISSRYCRECLAGQHGTAMRRLRPDQPDGRGHWRTCGQGGSWQSGCPCLQHARTSRQLPPRWGQRLRP